MVKVSTKPARDPVSVYLREVEGSTPPTPFKPSLKYLMRKIERQMNDAITNGKDFKSGNTQVITLNNMGENVSFVYLHDNLIAIVDDNGIKLYDGDHQTATTKSRLNAILSEHGIAGESVFQKNFEWFIRLYNGTEFFVTKFTSGMRLGTLSHEMLLC